MKGWKLFFTLLLLAGLILSLAPGCGDDDDDDNDSADDDDDSGDDDSGDDDTGDDDDDQGPTFLPVSGRWIRDNLHLRPYYAMLENNHYVLVATRKLVPNRDAPCYKASASMKQIWAAYTGNSADQYPESCADGRELPFDLESTPKVVPYPNDLYLVPDAKSITGSRVWIDGDTALPMGRIAGMGLFNFVTEALNELNGFSTAADLYLPMGTEPNPNSLPDEIDPGVQDSLFVMSHAAGAQSSKSVDRYAPILQQLELMGLDSADILSIADFSTLWVTQGLNEVRQLLDQMAEDSPPVLTDWEFFPHAWPELTGFAYANLHTPRFQNKDGHWVRDENGKLTVQFWEDVQVLFSLPAPDAHPDGQPFPLVLYGHGIGDRKESLSVDVLVKAMSENGMVLAGIDALCHGNRAPIKDDPTTAMLCYYRFLNPLQFRDNLRETIANKMWFARALRNLGDIDIIPEGGDGIPDFDTDHIFYQSISFGSIHGGVLSAVEENIDAYVMSSAAAKYTGVALEGPYMGAFVDIAKSIDQMAPGLFAEELLWLFGGMMQHVLDAGDPINYLPHTNKDPLPGMEGHTPAVLQQSSSEDFMLGGPGTAYFCRAGGWPQLEPYVWDVQFVDHEPCPHTGSGFFQYDTDEHFLLWMYGSMADAYREQAMHFLRTHYEKGAGEIIETFVE